MACISNRKEMAAAKRKAKGGMKIAAAEKAKEEGGSKAVWRGENQCISW